MGYKLCTAEKPSVAKDIARVVGADKKENGYYIGNDYIVTWAVGHLVGLADPEAYGFVKQEDMYSDDKAKEQAYAELPLLPQEFKLIVLEPTKEQFEIVKDLMHRPDVDYIIDCGDMGAEGHILQWFIREKAGNTKPVKRFCATSMTDEAMEQTPAICLYAVRRNGNALEYVKRQTPKICLAAVRQNGKALRYVQNQTPELCMVAVRQNFEAINFVKDTMLGVSIL